MIPIALRLTNFMSYGTSAPSLDFERFHVACLSGRNGQGKSALLDAITWALWGEARKSSGSHKPDDELIRIGTREMEVDLVFDIEGERYRVTRLYQRSATGKTSRGQLELHVCERDGDFRPLTGASMRETQQHLDRVLGLDYDTFINSAFLLQGRSDEFTKKKPSERKEILARILNLSRYERLAELARERERAAKEQCSQGELELERLKKALEEEPRWQEEREAAEAAIREEQAALATLRAEEKRLTERLATLEALAREADALQQTREGLDRRRAQHEQDVRRLDERIAEAEALLAQRDQIQRDHDRYEALQREREQLDVKRDLYRGVEKQIEQREMELRDRKNELEKKLHAFEVELKSMRASHGECVARLAEAPALERLLGKARAAQQRLEEMTEVLRQRKALEEQIADVERLLMQQREALNGRLEALEEQLRQDAEALASAASLQERHEAVQAAHARLLELRAELEEVRKEGQELGEALKEREGRQAAMEKDLRKQRDHFDRFRASEDGNCPTCGTVLTPAHRQEVEADYRQAIEALEAQLEETAAWIRAQEARRRALRGRYKTLQQQIDERADVPAQLGTLEEQLRSHAETVRAHKQRQADAAALRAQRDAKAYGEADRRRWRELKQEHQALPFDEEAYEQVREEAVQASRYEAQLRELAEVDGRREQLERAVKQADAQAGQLREQLDDGSAFAALRAQIDQLRGQLAGIGFDPRRFDEVRQSLRELSQAGARLKDLVNAQQNQEDWKAQRASARERLDQIHAERTQCTARLAEVRQELQEKAALEAAQRRKGEACRALEQRLQVLQVQLGELTARLDQARQDRAALRAARKAYADAKAERVLYRHLRMAFGRHGIPSLIIEHTLPEIEDRANVLLDRLSDGRMHVKLETLKDKKTGGTKETLEIIITDEQGVARPYETFSGGEAFRVNFALRIALAQLLAERSGVRIRTLVIDEGFGTQDAQGVQNMVEAIQAIQDDFDKIVVITHLDELKEAFPVRIEVEKDPVEGSRFEILGV